LAADGVTARVLVVNDDFDAAEVLARAIAAQGYDVRRAHDHDGAVATIVTDRFDAAVLDLSRGGASANNRLLDAIRASSEDAAQAVRVVVIGPSPSAAVACWQRGVDGYLVRPFHIRDLMAMLVDVVTRSEDERAAHREAEQRHLV